MHMTSLQNYTTYSILSGIMQPKEWVQRAVECGFTSLAITDKKNVSGWINFQEECKKADIKPIFGIEVSVTENVETKGDQGVVLLYAMNDTGIANIIEISNFSYRKIGDENPGGFYFHPRVTPDVLNEFSEGVACIVPTAKFGYGVGIKKDLTVSRTRKIARLIESFGENIFFGYDGFDTPMIKLEVLQKQFPSVRTVPVFNAHFPEPKHKPLYEIVRKIDESQGRSLKNAHRSFSNGWMPTLDEIDTLEAFTWISDEMIENTEAFIQSCNAEVPTGTYHLPKLFATPQETKKFLENIILKNYGRKVGEPDYKPQSLDEIRANPKYKERMERLDYEIDTIEKMNYLDYFAIETAICKSVVENGFQWGIARGSAGGSEFANMLDIIQVDPIKHGLIFERFLNPDRNDLPDIDSDMCKGGRDHAIQFCKQLLGEDAVVSIGTFMTLKVVSAIQKIAQAYSYGIPNNDGSVTQYDPISLNNAIGGQHVTQTKKGRDELDERLENPAFKHFYDRHSKFIEDVVMPLQGTITGTGIHAAGTLLLPYSYAGNLPVQYRDGRYISQWRDTDCEKRGFVKYDFLGLTNLSVIGHAAKLIYDKYGIEIPPADQLDFTDEKVLNVFRSGDTEGVFQVNSYLHQQYLPFMRPNHFNDIVAALALVRPGPMGINADREYALRKNGEIPVEYLHDDLDESLNTTYGVMVYQEQMMKICVDMAGMTRAESDKVRKACGKKKPKEMAKLKPLFVNGGIKNGYDEDLMESMWAWFISFAEYSFNKSHSVGYALIAWQQAWLKAYYPLEFWCGVLKFAAHDVKKQNNIWNARLAAERDGIEFVFPNYENFYEDFTPIGDNKIGWPVSAIKGVGKKVVEELTIDGRSSFESMMLMYWNINRRVVNAGVFAKLIKAGFFAQDGMPNDVILEYKRNREMDGSKYRVSYEFEKDDAYYWTKQRNEIMGMIVTPWREALKDRFSPDLAHLTDKDFDTIEDGTRLTIGGEIVKMDQKKISRGRNKGLWFAKLVVEDHGVTYKVMLWSGFWDSSLNPGLGSSDMPRPRKGDIVEIEVEKARFFPDPEGEPDKYYHQFVVNDSSHSLRVVCR